MLEKEWTNDARWAGVERPFGAAKVAGLRGTVQVQHTLAKAGSQKLWNLLNTDDFVYSLEALTGKQAMQMARAGQKAIYVSGWQVAADGNSGSEMVQDQSLYPLDSVPKVVKRINNTLLRADQIHHADGNDETDWILPLVADAGIGGVLNAYELMKSMIEAGAAAVHFEDQLSSTKKCGHRGAKVLVPTEEAIEKLVAARLAADICDVPTIIIARTDAESAGLLTSAQDKRDRHFCTGEKTQEGLFRVRPGLEQAISRGLSYAPYADVLWCETSKPDLRFANNFAKAIHARYPAKLLAYNCSPSFNWSQNMDRDTISRFQYELGTMGYKLQFVTQADFHATSSATDDLARRYKDSGMSAYTELQNREFGTESLDHIVTRHQREDGTDYSDDLTQVIMYDKPSRRALYSSTEEALFSKRSVFELLEV
jgi:isocitrate lyase